MVVYAYVLEIDRVETYSYKRVLRMFGKITDRSTGKVHDMFMDVHREYTRAIIDAGEIHMLLMDTTSKKIAFPFLDERDYLMNGVLYETKDAHTVFSFGGLICKIEPCVPGFRLDTLSMLLSTADRLSHLRGDIHKGHSGCRQGTEQCSESATPSACTS